MTQRLHCRNALLGEGWREDVTLELDRDGCITGIHAGRLEGAERLPGPVLPGMVNVHSHIHQRLIAGLTGQGAGPEDSFWSWRERMYEAVGLLSGEDFRTLAAWGFIELLEGGYTTTGEFHYPHRLGGQSPHTTAEQVLAAAAQAGCGLTLLPVWYRHGGFGRQPLGERQQPFGMTLEEIVTLVDSLKPEAGGLQRVGVAPHSLRAVDARDLPALLEGIPAGPVHLHISEQPAEVEACLQHHGCRPVEWLLRHVEVDDRWCLIHATHASEEEVRALAERSAVIGICPTTEADLGDGLFPVREYLDGGGRVAVGSDSNLVMSAAEELRLLEWGQRLRLHQRNVLCGAGEHVGTSLWRHAARSGSHALDQPAGVLAEGRRADLVVLDESHPMLAGLSPEDMLDSFVFSHAAGMIDEVFVAGRRVVAAGRHPARSELAGRVAELRRRLAGARAS
ncbi:MAG: formimidoylglutamate deiminase [Wenzhouxiangella sp.]|jgi:formimidoylglutamate deiminase|nr:formimidoylglutamate deiminase [Wenzhouxiangella sp.]